MAELDMHSLVTSAYEQAEANEASNGESAEPVAESLAVGDSGVAETAPGTAETTGDDGGSRESSAAKADRARDEKGKFAPKPKESQALKPAAPKTAAVAEGVAGALSPTGGDSQLSPPPAEALKAPQGWKPSAREQWAKLPPEVQAETVRRERETEAALREAAPAKRFHQEFGQAIAPFEGMLRQSGFANPIQAVQAAFQTINQLQTSDPRGRAQVFANLLKSYPADIETLAGLIDGAPQQAQQPAHIDPRAIAAQVRQEVMNDFQAQRQQQNEARISKDLEAFTADPKNEFFNDVAPVMAALIRSVPQGQKIDINAIYERAIWSDPGIRDIIQKRASQVAGKAATASTQQARIAASSVKSTPSTGASSIRAPKTDKERVEAAWEALDR